MEFNAHEYRDVDPEQAYSYLQAEFDVYDDFGQQVAAWASERYM